MHVIEARNVNDALVKGMHDIREYGQERDSRNGKVLVMPGPVTTQYHNPQERVLFEARRDCNPFFHFFEGLWMIAGQNDVASVSNYVKRMETFSDDGVTLHGAYGHRWRTRFGLDQLMPIAAALLKDPTDRRQVLQMWDARADLGRNGKDVPCNTQAYFSRDYQGRLDMTVCCRSNDMIWGAYGANAVHFSMLQEYMAAAIGCPIGQYWQMSNNFHTYLDTYTPLADLADGSMIKPCRYELVEVKPYSMVNIPIGRWNQEFAMFMTEGMVLGITDPFFKRVAAPILHAHQTYKELSGADRYDAATAIVSGCMASDWRTACEEWLARRKKSWLRARDDGPAHE